MSEDIFDETFLEEVRNMASKVFIDAILSGDMKGVTNLLNAGFNVGIRGEKDSTPLHWAAASGQQAMVELLIDRGADVNAVDENGATPLMLAVLRGHIKMVELLLDRGSDVNEKYSKGMIPLHFAAMEGKIRIAELLLDSGANVNNFTEEKTEALKIAVDFVQALPRDPGKYKRANSGWTPLHYAISENQIKMTKFLLDRGADIEARSEDCTPLLLSIVIPEVDSILNRKTAKANMVKILIKRGAINPV